MTTRTWLTSRPDRTWIGYAASPNTTNSGSVGGCRKLIVQLERFHRGDVAEQPPTKLEINKKHLKNVGPIRHCEPPHAHSPGVASGTVARRLRIDVHDNNDNDNA